MELINLIDSTSFLLRLFVQIKTAHLSGRLSYASVMESAFGSAGYYLISFLQFLYPFLGEGSFDSIINNSIETALPLSCSVPSHDFVQRRRRRHALQSPRPNRSVAGRFHGFGALLYRLSRYAGELFTFTTARGAINFQSNLSPICSSSRRPSACTKTSHVSPKSAL